MRPVTITGVTGTSQWVPIDTYSPARAGVASNVAALAIEYTYSNVFDASPAPVPIVGALAGGVFAVPEGVRAIRGTAMAPADIMVVSQQGIA